MRLLAVVVIGLSFVSHAYAQDAIRFRSWGHERARVIVPENTTLSDQDALRILRGFDGQVAFPGLPTTVLAERRITISVVSTLEEGIDGRALLSQDLVVLPAKNVARWDDDKLYRVIRHELAHIALSIFMGGTPIPTWFDEGYAEWVAGGLTCESQARLMTHVNVLVALGAEPPALREPKIKENRITYDLYVSFFAFLSDRFGPRVSYGTLLRSVKARGAEAGTAAYVGGTFDDLERDWQQHLIDSFGQLLDQPRCRDGYLDR